MSSIFVSINRPKWKSETWQMFIMIDFINNLVFCINSNRSEMQTDCLFFWCIYGKQNHFHFRLSSNNLIGIYVLIKRMCKYICFVHIISKCILFEYLKKNPLSWLHGLYKDFDAFILSRYVTIYYIVGCYWDMFTLHFIKKLSN